MSLTYSNYEGKLGGSVKVNYSRSDNGINDIIFMKDGVLNSTYANIGREEGVRFELNGDWNISDALRWSVFYSAAYTDYRAHSEQVDATNHGWQHYVTTNINYTAPFKLRVSAYGGFFTPWIDLQSHADRNQYYYGLSLSRSFLKDDALNISVSTSNFAPYKKTNKYTQSDPSVIQKYRSDYKQWTVGLSISYKFGGLKASVRKTNADIESESTGKQGGGK